MLWVKHSEREWYTRRSNKKSWNSYSHYQRNLRKILLSCQTTPVLSLTTNLGIVAIRFTPQALLTSATKEIVADAASGGAWLHRTTRQVIRAGVDGSTTGDIGNDICIIETSYPALIVIIGTAPPCGLNHSQDIGDIRQSTSPVLVIKPPKFGRCDWRKGL